MSLGEAVGMTVPALTWATGHAPVISQRFLRSVFDSLL